jgi:hypothetical protein
LANDMEEDREKRMKDEGGVAQIGVTERRRE